MASQSTPPSPPTSPPPAPSPPAPSQSPATILREAENTNATMVIQEVIGEISSMDSLMASAQANVWADAAKTAVAEAARLHEAASKAADVACDTATSWAVAHTAAHVAKKRKLKATTAHHSAVNFAKSLRLKEAVDQEKADVARSIAEHADLATAAAISKLKSSMDRDDGFLLFKGMVDKEEDLDPSVRDEMLKKAREYFYAGPNIGFSLVLTKQANRQ